MNTKSSHWNVKISKKWLKLFLVFTIIGIIIFANWGYSDRASLSQVLGLASGYKMQVREFIASHGVEAPVELGSIGDVMSVGQYRDIYSESGEPFVIEYFEISPKGKITILTSGIYSYLELSPIVEDDLVREWHCYGRPKEKVPVACHTEKLMTNH
jgi:hypothetical protein